MFHHLDDFHQAVVKLQKTYPISDVIHGRLETERSFIYDEAKSLAYIVVILTIAYGMDGQQEK